MLPVTDPRAADVAAQIASLAARVPGDGAEASVSLSVGDLGAISLRVSVSGDVVTVVVDAASAAARHLLETAEPRLAQDLSALGLSLGDRSAAADGRGEPNRGPPLPGPRPPDRGEGRAEPAAPPAAPPAEPRLVRHVNLLA